MNTILLAAASEPTSGWGNPAALLIAFGLFWAGTRAYARWKNLDAQPPSPSTPAPALDGVKPQVGGTVDTTTEGAGEGKVAAPRPLDSFVAARDGKASTGTIVRAAGKRFGASKSTVLRALRRVRERENAEPGPDGRR